MINYIDAEKLKAEIERRKELLAPHKGQGVGLCREVIRQFDSLLSFIDIISHPITKGGIIDEIRAEIERRFLEYNHDSNHHIQAAECASILDFIDSLQQEQSEVDLEKEIDHLWDDFSDEISGPHNKFDIYARVARHFYELGLKARKK